MDGIIIWHHAFVFNTQFNGYNIFYTFRLFWHVSYNIRVSLSMLHNFFFVVIVYSFLFCSTIEKIYVYGLVLVITYKISIYGLVTSLAYIKSH